MTLGDNLVLDPRTDETTVGHLVDWGQPQALREGRQLAAITSYGTTPRPEWVQNEARADMLVTCNRDPGGALELLVQIKTLPTNRAERSAAKLLSAAEHLHTALSCSGTEVLGGLGFTGMAGVSSSPSFEISAPAEIHVGDFVSALIQRWYQPALPLPVDQVMRGAREQLPGQISEHGDDLAFQRTSQLDAGEDDDDKEPLPVRYFRDLTRWLQLTDGEVADALGLGRTTVYSWRHGHVPRPRNLRLLYKAHAPIAAVVQMLGEPRGVAWLHGGSPSPAEMLMHGDLDALSRVADEVVFGKPRRPSLEAWVPDEALSSVNFAPAPIPRPRRRRRRSGKTASS